MQQKQNNYYVLDFEEEYDFLDKTKFHDISCPLCKTSIEGSHAVVNSTTGGAIIETGINTVCQLTWIFNPICKAILKGALKKYQDVQMTTELATKVCKKVWLCKKDQKQE